MSFRVVLSCCVAALAACGERAPTPEPITRPAPRFEPVIQRALAATAPPTEPPPAGEVDAEELSGLIAMFAGGDARFTEAAESSVAELSGDVAAALFALASDGADEERAAAIGLLGARGDAAAAARLVDLLRDGEPAWIRAHAAWRLGETDADQTVPALLLRLKYERDHEAVLWIADTLARFGNFAGAAVIERLAVDPATPAALQRSARAKQLELGELAQPPDGLGVVAAWERALLDVPERSRAFEHAVWSWIARLEEYQLRGVDDARFLLERSDPSVAKLLGQALLEPDRYVRVHAAQCLARMGPRGRAAEAQLVALLGDPLAAHEAAAALGRLDTATAEAELRRELQAGGVEVQVTAARALRWRLERAAPETRELLVELAADATSLPELRQAALESLAYLGELDREHLTALLDFAEDERFEADTTIRALRFWLGEHAPETLIAEFDALAPEGGEVVTWDARRRSRRARAALVREHLDALVGA
ncbi:MAG: HEAT repeat domain-containing protein [Planctomycetota bacterium]